MTVNTDNFIKSNIIVEIRDSINEIKWELDEYNVRMVKKYISCF